MSEFATRTTTSPGSSSSSERSTNSARIFLSGVSVSWYALNLSTEPPALALQVIGRLHLVEAAYRAGELRAVGPLRVERLGLRLGGYDGRDPFVVSGEARAVALYAEGAHSAEFARAVSRLHEM